MSGDLHGWPTSQYTVVTYTLSNYCGVCGQWLNGRRHVCDGVVATAQGAVPHKCPVCEGKGKVEAGFYSLPTDTSVSDPMCRACAGSGVVWR